MARGEDKNAIISAYLIPSSAIMCFINVQFKTTLVDGFLSTFVRCGKMNDVEWAAKIIILQLPNGGGSHLGRLFGKIAITLPRLTDLAIVTCWVLGTMVISMKNQTVDIEVLIYQNTQCISI